MGRVRFARVCCGACAVALLPGCQWGSSRRLSSTDMQNRMLAEQNQAQLQEIENLKAHNRTVENQLIQAEEELAELDQRVGVDRKQIANYQRERAPRARAGRHAG